MYTEMFQTIQDTLIKKIDPVFIIIFGSYAKKSTHKDSDIDIAFYCEDQSLTTYEVFQLAQELADILKIEVDLVNIRTASTVFKAQIYTTGTVIYSVNDTLLKNLQMTALSMYAKLNEERENILKKIGESGTIYEE
ncbi:nucleotidyltransferase domain-containing protein [Peribacillus simplex]|uniref:type VII toxin-antitoxin system MntA family adenylyltransferase antitoxin n=1 Tax=Peribacillus simplex TaxID=1478 RepID=UPI00137B39DD|nr:nucleotidyltransferase domain-containing protein [Peribacillus simplex]MBD8590385.1 nucleotidyltransferase domain-containing protein [Peribacillus simplex]NCT39694.1 nucleotidyltransferase domain-containing protein [Peribacillus frigoritolerans]